MISKLGRKNTGRVSVFRALSWLALRKQEVGEKGALVGTLFIRKSIRQMMGVNQRKDGNSKEFGKLICVSEKAGSELKK